MAMQDNKRFPRSFIGYNRGAVDSEFERLSAHAEQLTTERQNLQDQLESLNQERAAVTREQVQLNTQLTAVTGQLVDLETSLSQAKAENDTLARAIEAHKAEKNAMQLRFDQLRERDRDFAVREREFAELQSSVASIMSVTKRATDRLFQKAVENQENVIQIAGDAAREVATIRADMAEVRDRLNQALDEVQDRIDRVDASLTGAVHKLVAIKHNDGLQTDGDQPTILSEVEQLLSMRPGDIDQHDGKVYTGPVLGPYGAKFVADTAQRVNDGRITPKPAREGAAPEVRKVNPSHFDSTDDSILEANNLLDRGGMTAQEFYADNPQFVPDGFAEQQQQPAAPRQIGFSGDETSDDDSVVIPLGAPDSDDGTGFTNSAAEGFSVSDAPFTAAGGYIGDYPKSQPVGYGAAGTTGGYQYYPSRSYYFQPYDAQPKAAAPRSTRSASSSRPAASRARQTAKKVTVHAIKAKKAGR